MTNTTENIEMTHIRNAVWFEDGRIDCEWEHPTEGWIVYSASAEDSEERGRLLYQTIWDSGDYIVAPEKTPERKLYELRVEARMPKGDFVMALYSRGVLTFDEADLAASGGWPAPFVGAIAPLPDADKLQAKITWRSALNVTRLDPLLITMAQHTVDNPLLVSITPEDLDVIFGITVAV